jgi:hypothetical protein
MRTPIMFTLLSLLAGSAAQAAFYQPDLSGPLLDPTLSFTGDPGFTHSVNGSLGLFKAGGVTEGEGEIVSSFTIPIGSEFTASLTIGNVRNIGFTNFRFEVGTLFNNGPGSPLAQIGISNNGFNTPGTTFYYGFTNIGPNFFGSIELLEEVAVLEVQRDSTHIETRVNGHVLSTSPLVVSAVGDYTFSFKLFGVTSTPDPADRAVFISNFSVLTPGTCGGAAPCPGGVPEPDSWALLIAGFGLTGAMARRRRRQRPA